MSNKVPLTITAFVLSAAVLATMIPTMSGAQGKDAVQPVEVRSPLPLPVTGAVNVGNFPVFPSTFNVRQNDDAPPLRIRPAEIERLRTIATVSMTGGERCTARLVAQAEPERRVVLEHISVLFITPTEQRIAVVALQLLTNTVPPWRTIDAMRPEVLGQLEPGFLSGIAPHALVDGRPQFSAINQNTRIYLDGGEQARLLWCRDSPGPPAYAEISVSGFVQ